MRLSWLAASVFFGAIITGPPALASSVNLTFGSGFVRTGDPTDLTGEFTGTGFAASATQNEGSIFNFEGARFGSLSSDTTGHDVFSIDTLRITRTDARSFNLRSIDIGSFYSGFLGFADGFDENGDIIRDSIEVALPSLGVRGVYEDGGSIEINRFPFADSASVANGANGERLVVTEGADTPISFGGEFANLSALEISATLDFDIDEVICRPENLGRINQVVAASGICDTGVAAQGDPSELTYNAAWAGPRNDGAALSLTSIEVQPVPVPSSLLLLLSTLAPGLFLARSRGGGAARSA